MIPLIPAILDSHRPQTPRTLQNVEGKDPLHQLRPCEVGPPLFCRPGLFGVRTIKGAVRK